MTMKEFLVLLMGLPCCLTALAYTFGWAVGIVEPLAFSSERPSRKYLATCEITRTSVACQEGRIVPIVYTGPPLLLD